MWKEVKPLSEVYNIKKNLFDVLRFVFAIMVIYAHSFSLVKNSEGAHEFVFDLTKGQTNAGSVAVLGFFVLSGFLTTQSIENSRGYIDYLKKRMLRVVPAFLVALVATALILGPIYTTKPVMEYLLNKSTWQYIWYNITFNIGENYMSTPNGLFNNAHYAGTANGASWTLPLEVSCYVLLIFLSAFFFLRIRTLMLIFTLFVGFLHFLNMKYQYLPAHLPVKYFWALGDFQLPHFLNFGFYYCAGSLIYLYRDKILYSHRFLVFSLLALFCFIKLGHIGLGFMIFWPYIVIGVGISFSFQKFHKLGDPSYGLYIYAFPIQQAISMTMGSNFSVYGLFFSSFIITFIFSMISWNFIEKPMLKLKKINLLSRYFAEKKVWSGRNKLEKTPL
jgi:peptidoglycan/LPS O-acetylase OafA/YrhL